MSMDKVAAILRDYPRLRKENKELQEKLALLGKERRVNQILQAVYVKQAQLPEECRGFEQLMKLSDEKLSTLELALRMQSPEGVLKLGEVDEDGKPDGTSEREGMTALHELLLTDPSEVLSGDDV